MRGENRVLYLVAESSLSADLRHHGSSKDVEALLEYFVYCKLNVTQVAISRRRAEVQDQLDKLDFGGVHLVCVSLPGSHFRLLQGIRRRLPQATLLFRAHNAEFLHRLDWAAASKHWSHKLLFTLRAIRGLVEDIKTVWFGPDRILAISQADARQYWWRLGPRSRTVVVPYFHPGAVPTGPFEKNDLCVAVTAVQSNPLIADAIDNFYAAVRGLGGQLPVWRFAITGSVDSATAPERVELLGRLDSPSEILVRARAVAVLSDYGRGFKTKLLEAVIHQCWILITPALMRRLPPELLPFCIVVDRQSPASFRLALEQCSKPWPGGDVNAALRAQAFAAMHDIVVAQ